MSKRRSPLRVFVGRLAVALVVATLFMGGAVFAVNYVIDRKLDKVTRVKVATASAPEQGANYLVIGSDTRAFVKNAGDEKAFGDEGASGGQRSDTMMVVHVEPDAKTSIIVSFPRDLWVNIPGVGMSKINAAFNSGPDKVIETLKANFGVEINHYMEVDFQSFKGVVRAIGNVPVYFPYPARDDKTGLFIYQPGCVRLDGPGSLAYVRSRDQEYYSTVKSKWVAADAVPDIDRIKRQQDFIRELASLAVAKSLNDPFTANEIADRVLENLKIDQGLSKDDILSLISAFRTINPDDSSALDFETLPWTNGPAQNGQSVLYPKETADANGPAWRTVADSLQDFSGNTIDPNKQVAPSTVSMRVLNGSGQTGAASSALAQFKKLGFKTSGSGNDSRGTVATTEVRYKPGESPKGSLVLRYFPSARLVADPNLKGVDVAVVLGADFTGTIVKPADTTTTSAVTTATTAAQATTATTQPKSTGPQIANQSQLGDPAPRTPPC